MTDSDARTAALIAQEVVTYAEKDFPGLGKRVADSLDIVLISEGKVVAVWRTLAGRVAFGARVENSAGYCYGPAPVHHIVGAGT